MSLARSSCSVRRRCQQCLQPSICSPASSFPGSNQNLRSVQNRILLHSQPAPQPSPKSFFHTTSSKHASRPAPRRTPPRAPTIRRAENRRSQGGPLREPIVADSVIDGNLATHLAWLHKEGKDQWANARVEKLLTAKFTWEIFESVGRHLITAAHNGPPSATAIENNPSNRIDMSPTEVYDFGRMILPENEAFQLWLETSGALANVTPAVCSQAARYLNDLTSQGRGSSNNNNNKQHLSRNVPILQAVEALATGPDRDPRAMHLHARILGAREQYRDAMALLDEVLECIRPGERKEARPDTVLTASPTTFWDSYLWIHGEMADLRFQTRYSRDEILRIAAKEFQDPKYLEVYAGGTLRERRDWAEYEECMLQAAMAGNPKASRRLATFYHFTAQGRYPRRGEEESAADFQPEGRRLREEKERSFLVSLYHDMVGTLPSLTQYRIWAKEWFRHSIAHGNPESVVILAVLEREDGNAAEGEQILRAMLRDMQLKGPEREKLKETAESFLANWSDPKFQPQVQKNYYIL
ncbi:uncharacterized protein BO97DRAFT_478906 [Aspergillus homomorphus CBS 101889]|uniref:Uncharacterized protein n=1 Tax=Aspergillus homomorphus (strain CBS 101889) TaxID=1450537 RepID=A0A395HU75_ASPHC|nr:hypothetical protein BO97DRAFT_478906 [Aspergillus homomorphus CBS 101889]RAL11069.1 hypothetical protein BO97DRAFT_478906 [Aspergillus homomorphus CBS 101889]